ncbi:transmembrane protein 272 isoform X1 [Coregonus clupeaformis]|uniref:transmembrane protein 272 isoform X1 n=1 Tax=Coregonus clupeaformis TaxID=59861 RepID=UPI001E1C5793|nr:transmembrane protein 272 isoform X1 [Coregonus clupeaformis]
MKRMPSRLLLVCSNILPVALLIANIAMGAVYLNDCPRQPYIPIYLIVLGAFGLVTILPFCFCQPNLVLVCTLWNGLLDTFLFCWFINGNVWIYSIYQPNYNQTLTEKDPYQSNYNQTLTEKDLYCNKTLYLFAFWTTTLNYLILLSLCVVLCCCCCGVAICACIEGGPEVERVPMGESGDPEGEI